MNFLKQSALATINLGPFVDDTDGKTAETGLTISQADVRLSKNGGVFAQKNNADAAVHSENGSYLCALSTIDTNTLGRLRVEVHESGALPVWENYEILPENVFDSLISGSDKLDVNVAEISEDSAAADSLEAILDGTGAALTLISSQSAGQALLIKNTGSNGNALRIENTDVAGRAAYVTSSGTSEGTVLVNNTGSKSAIILTGKGTGQAALKLTNTDTGGYGIDINSHSRGINVNTTAGTGLYVVGSNTGVYLEGTSGQDINAGEINTIDTVVDAIKAKTDNLPADPASETNVNANETKIDSLLTRVPSGALTTIDTVVDAIKAKTDSLTFTVANQVDSNVKSISDDGPAADSLEAILDGTGAKLTIKGTGDALTIQSTNNGSAINLASNGTNYTTVQINSSAGKGIAFATQRESIYVNSNSTYDAIKIIQNGAGGGKAISVTAQQNDAVDVVSNTGVGLKLTGATKDIDANEIDNVNVGSIVADALSSIDSKLATEHGSGQWDATAALSTVEAALSTIDTVVDAIKAKTDNLPADPASETNVDANEAKLDSALAALTTIDSNVDDTLTTVLANQNGINDILTDTDDMQTNGVKINSNGLTSIDNKLSTEHGSGDWDAVAALTTVIDALTTIDTHVLERATPAQVNAQVLDVMATDTHAEPAQAAPSNTPTITDMINQVYRKIVKDKVTATSSEEKTYMNDGSTVRHKRSISDNGTTVTKGAAVSG